MATKAICIWLDETSEPGTSAWIVSRDEINEAGEAETTSTLRTYEDGEYDAALTYAKSEAAKRSLPLYSNPADGPAVLLQEAV